MPELVQLTPAVARRLYTGPRFHRRPPDLLPYFRSALAIKCPVTRAVAVAFLVAISPRA